MTTVYWRQGGYKGPEPTSLPRRVDVAVIGAGFAGLSIALDLQQAEPELRIVLLESNHVGHGASGRNAGLVLPLALPWLLPGSTDQHSSQHLLHKRVMAQAQQLHDEYPAAEVRSTNLVLIATNRLMAAGLAWTADALATSGIETTRWPADQVAATCGAPARGALVLDAWTIHPAALTALLANRFVARGGTLHEHTRVNAVIPTPTDVEIHTNSAQLRADHAVICTGAYTDAIAAPSPPPARPVHTYMRASQHPTDTSTPGLFVSVPGPGMAYWRIHDHHLLFGGLDINGLTPGTAADALPRAHRRLDQLLHRRLPDTTRQPATHRWAGAMHVTRTEVPHLSRSATSDRIIYAVGYSGSGVALALASGPLVRDLILGPTRADPEAVALRQTLQTTTIHWRSLLATIRPGATHLLRGLTPYR